MKKYLKYVGFMVLVLSIVLAGSLVFAAPKQLTIGVSIPTADHGWTGGVVWWAKQAIQDWEKKDGNVKFFLVTADSPAKQVADVEDLMSKGIDALVILPYDSAPLTPVVEEVHDKGIYTVVCDRGLVKDVHDILVVGDNPGVGRVSAAWMAKAMGNKGDLVILEGVPCVANTERVEGFKEVMKKFPDIKILDSQPAYWQTQKGLEVMENYLQKYQSIDAVWAGDDDVLKGVLQAYKESGRKEIKIFLGCGGAKEIVKMIIDGNELVRSDVTFTPSEIATSISLAVMGLRGESLNGFYQMKPPSKIVLASELITPENAKNYYFPDSVY